MFSGADRVLSPPPLLLLPLLLLLGPVSSLPEGAPTSACTTLRPKHGSHQPQEGSAPFELTSEEDGEVDGQWLVTLTATGDQTFSGLLLQARPVAGDDTTPLGQFQEVEGTKLLDCAGRKQVSRCQVRAIPRDATIVTPTVILAIDTFLLY